MPLATLHLLSLNPQTSLHSFLTDLRSANIKPITISKVIRWIIVPEKIDTAQLLSPVRPYDLLLILPGTTALPGPLEAKTSATFSLQIGIPSRLLSNYTSTNQSLLHPDPSSVPSPTGSLDKPIIKPSSQTLTLSPDLQHWISEFSHTHTGKNAVSMLNLLSFHPDKRESYITYGKAFAETIGSKRGGNAKLVGHVVYPGTNSKDHGSGSTTANPGDKNVLDVPAVSLAEDADSKDHNTGTNPSDKTVLDVPAVSLAEEPSSSKGSSQQQQGKWDEFALAHYPSITHFADMLASEDYQAVNQKYRVPALRDTCILCTSEIEIEEVSKRGGEGVGKSKL